MAVTWEWLTARALHYARLRTPAWRRDDREDIAQDALLALWRETNMDTLKQDAALLNLRLKRAVIDALRRGGTHGRRGTDQLPAALPPLTLSSLADKNSQPFDLPSGLPPLDDRVMTAAIITMLRPRERMLVRALLRGYEQQDVARLWGVTPSAVSYALRAARGRLEDAI